MTGGNSVVRCRTRMSVAFLLAASALAGPGTGLRSGPERRRCGSGLGRYRAHLDADGPEGDRAGVLLQPDEPRGRILVGADRPAGVGVRVRTGQVAIETDPVGVAGDCDLVVVPGAWLQRRTP